MARSDREECLRQAQSNFTPAEIREWWGVDNLSDLTDDQLTRGVEYQKIIRRDAKTGKILNDYRKAYIDKYISDYTRAQLKRADKSAADVTPEQRKKYRRQAITNLLVRDLSDDAGRTSIEANSQAITAYYQSRIAQAADAMKPERLGVKRQSELVNDVVDELHRTGSSKNPDAKRYATDLTKVFTDLLERFNRAGGGIRRLQGWAMPHSSNATLIAKVSQTQFVADTLPLLNRNRYTTPWGEPLDDNQLREFLGAVYNNIVSDGVVEGTGTAPISALHREHRELHFRNGKDYRIYADKYGDQNLYKSMTDHIERMSRQIALMETLGADPDKAFKSLTSDFDKDSMLQAIWTNLRGFDRPDRKAWADAATTTRQLLSSAQLGSAILSSFTDMGTASVNAAFNGLGWTRMLSRLGELNTPEARQFAAQLGASIDYALDGVGASMRFDDSFGSGWAQRAADVVFRASGLTGYTNLLRRAHFMEFSFQLGNHAGKRMDELETNFKGMLESYGVTPQEWNIIRTAKKRQRNNETFLDVTSIKDEGVLTKIMGVMHQERDLAVIMPDVRTRAITNMGLSEDTVKGQGWRALTQYKSFPVAVMMNNLFRYAASKRLGIGGRVQYTAGFTAITTLLGGLSVQLKEIAKGRDPRPINDTEFFGAAFLQGGGFGIMGDFLFGESNRYGQPAWATALGPTGGLMYDIGRVGGDMAKGDYDKAAILGRYVPGQSLWYTRLIYERAVLDSYRKLVDPDFEKNARRQQKRRKTSHNQESWWAPGKSPRLPDLTNMAADPPSPERAATNPKNYVPSESSGKKQSDGSYVPNI